MRESGDVAIRRVFRRNSAGPLLARDDVGVVVVLQQHLERTHQIRRPVLRLPIGAHDAVVAADAVVVLRGDTARIVERLLAREDHRRIRRHHEDALRVHQHRRLGVPIRLRADVDSGDDDVDLATRLSELDDAFQSCADPVHVLGAGFHRDTGPGGNRKPFDRDLQFLGQVQCCDDPGALRLRNGTEALRRIAGEDDPRDAFGVKPRRRRHLRDDDACGVESVGALDGFEFPVDEIQFDDLSTGRNLGGQLIRVHEPATMGTEHLRLVIVERGQRTGRWLGGFALHFPGESSLEAHREFLLVAIDPEVGVHDDLVDPRGVRERCDLVLQQTGLDRLDLDRRPDMHPDVIHVELAACLTTRRPGPTDRLEPVLDRLLPVRHGEQAALLVAHHSHLTHLRHGDEAAVGRVLLRRGFDEQHVLGRLQPLQVELREPPQMQQSCDHRVVPADDCVLDELIIHPVMGDVRDPRRDADSHRRTRDVLGQPRGELIARRIRRGVQRDVVVRGAVQIEDDRGVLSFETLHEFVDISGSFECAGVVDDGRDEDRRGAVHLEASDDMPVPDLQRREPKAAVVFPRQDFEHGLAAFDAFLQACGEGDVVLLGNRREVRDAVGVLLLIVGGGEIGDEAHHASENRGAFRVDLGLIEPAEPHRAGEVTEDAEAQLRGTLETFQFLARGDGEPVGWHRFFQPAFENAGDERDRMAEPLLGEEDPEDRGLEPTTPFEGVDSVVCECPLETLDEGRR